MIHASAFLSFHHCVNFLESARPATILTSILISCCLISFIMSDPSKKRRKFMRSLERLPGPKALPLVGNAPHLIFPPDEIFDWLESVNRKWGDVVRFWVFGSPKVFVNSYDVAMQLLSRKTFLQKSEEFEPLNPVGEHSLAGASPEAHPLRRKMLGPGFSRQVVENSLEIFCRHARKLRDGYMQFAENGRVFNPMESTGLCAYKIGCESAVGHEVFRDFWDMELKDQMKAWQTLLFHLVRRSFKPWLKYDSIFNRTFAGKQVQQSYQAINDFSEKVYILRRRHHEFLKANGFWDHDNSGKIEMEQECFLDLLIQLEDNEEMTKEQVLHDLNIFIVAGYDTTGTTLAWILHLLATHPEIQEKCVQELWQIFQEEPRPGSSASSSTSTPAPSFDTFTTTFSLIFATSDLPVTTAKLRSMKYLECCIKEALRLYPVLPWLLRRTNEDIELKDGRVIPAGVDVPINTYVIHRDSEQFPEPETFKPERYLDENDGSGKLSGLLSFGAGPRTCPGMLFAIQELKVLLSHLLLEFKWESAEEEDKNVKGGSKKCLFHGVLVPANGISVKITRRM